MWRMGRPDIITGMSFQWDGAASRVQYSECNVSLRFPEEVGDLSLNTILCVYE